MSEATKAGRRIGQIAVAYEAGRDGFWLARWLRGRGIRGACDPPDKYCRIARAPPGEDGSARYRVAEARLSWLAARRAGSLQHGKDPNA
jgi:hypothetical protein